MEQTTAFAALGGAIQSSVETVMDRWSAAARSELHQREETRRATIRDHLPQFLKALGDLLQSGGDPGEALGLAMEHGGQRWEVQWHLAELVRDYSILRRILLDCLPECLGRALSAEEVRELNRLLDESVALSVQVFTDHKQATLRRAFQRLQHAMPLVSHELRNQVSPLGIVARLLQLKPDDPAAVRRASAMLERHSDRLARLLTDLMDVTTLLADEISLVCKETDLVELVRASADDARPLLEDGQVQLELHLPAAPLVAVVDGDRVAQAVGNLLHNASKFTPAGGRVDVRLESRAGHARITVRDTGSGIEPAELRTIFEPYVQGKTGKETSSKGVGLGLAVVAKLMELHHGRVTADSEGPGQGASFTLELPLERG